MQHVSGRRTHPTVKPLVTMNRRKLRNWEIKLGLSQMVALIGIVTGCMACAFYLAYFTGHKRGFDEALASSLDSVVRLPIVESGAEREPVNPDLVSKVYAKLQNSGTADTHGDDHDEKIPELGAIQSAKVVEDHHVHDDPAAHAKSHVATKKEDADHSAKPAITDLIHRDEPGLAKQVEAAHGVRLVETHAGTGTHAGADKTGTLGSLLPAHDGERKKEEKQAAHVETASHKKPEKAEKMLEHKPADKIAKPSKEHADVPTHSSSHTDSKKVAPEAVQPQLFAQSDHGDGSLKNAKPKQPSSQTRVAAANAKQPRAKDAVPLQRKQTAGALNIPVQSAPAKTGKISPTSRVPHGWYAQVAAPSREGDALSLAGRLKASGFGVKIELARVRGQDYFRVLVGPEDARHHAERLIVQLKRESYLKGEPFIKLVK